MLYQGSCSSLMAVIYAGFQSKSFWRFSGHPTVASGIHLWWWKVIYLLLGICFYWLQNYYKYKPNILLGCAFEGLHWMNGAWLNFFFQSYHCILTFLHCRHNSLLTSFGMIGSYHHFFFIFPFHLYGLKLFSSYIVNHWVPTKWPLDNKM